MLSDFFNSEESSKSYQKNCLIIKGEPKEKKMLLEYIWHGVDEVHPASGLILRQAARWVSVNIPTLSTR